MLVDWADELVIVDWVGALVDWAGESVDWAGTMVDGVEVSAGALVDGILDMTVAGADDKAPLAAGSERVSEGTSNPLLSHNIVKSKYSSINQRTFSQKIVRLTHCQAFAARG